MCFWGLFVFIMILVWQLQRKQYMYINAPQIKRKRHTNHGFFGLSCIPMVLCNTANLFSWKSYFWETNVYINHHSYQTLQFAVLFSASVNTYCMPWYMIQFMIFHMQYVTFPNNISYAKCSGFCFTPSHGTPYLSGYPCLFPDIQKMPLFTDIVVKNNHICCEFAEFVMY